MVDRFAVSTKIAQALLLSNAHITLTEIEALPFVEDRKEACAVASRLLRLFAPPYHIEVDQLAYQSDVKLRLTVG